MAIQKIELGTVPHGVGGDSYRTANEKINSNFEEVGKDIQDALDRDVTLRRDLANPDKGATMVGYGEGTVADMLGEIISGAVTEPLVDTKVFTHNHDVNAHPELRTRIFSEVSSHVTAEADRAEAAASSAMFAGWMYADVTSGEAVRTDGDYFWVVSGDNSEVLELWLMGTTTASDTGKRITDKSLIDKLTAILSESELSIDAVFEITDRDGAVAFRVNGDATLETKGVDVDGNFSVKIGDDFAFEIVDSLGNLAFVVEKSGEVRYLNQVNKEELNKVQISIDDVTSKIDGVTTKIDDVTSKIDDVTSIIDGASPTPIVVGKSDNRAESLVAHWDFSELNEPYLSKAGRGGSFPLVNGEGSSVKSVNDGPFGHAVVFGGASKGDYLTLDASEIGDLNLSKFGDQVTMIAWVRASGGFVGGCWQEDNADPRRQYGMFINLPMYGGSTRVCGHVSYTGRPTPGYSYSRDYSTSARKIVSTEWRMVAFTYDGEKVISYLDGIADEIDSYTDHSGANYAKNPYIFDEGLNRFNKSDFTVGAVLLSNGMGNFISGRIGGLKVFNRALSSYEIMQEHLEALDELSPIVKFDFYTALSEEKIGDLGFRSYYSQSATNESFSLDTGKFLVKKDGLKRFIERDGVSSQEGDVISIALIDTLKNLRISQITKITFDMNNSNTSDSVKLAIKVGGKWYATSSDYAMGVAGVSGGDWTNSEVVEINVTRDASQWLELNLVDSELSLGSAVTSKLANEDFEAIGILSEGCIGVLRITDISIYN